ncbi:hypothetical protein MAM1_0116c05707 [Mucor ambiguus]|uniref:Uncharacterized protein n=1 Tax=Mucor ambiguus TaxID=91626 RepID=A0A0C9MSE3_9FUNG|nr:hypothetical protein MAM1_0116c05707 [Mucor ambiguus]
MDKHWHNDFIFTSKDGVELSLGEIKPKNTCNDAIEEDEIRALETMKKQLNMRLKCARTLRELQTFGVLIKNNQLELSNLELTPAGEYVFCILQDLALGTTSETSLEYDLSLEVFLSFIHLMEQSVVQKEELELTMIFHEYSHFIKPTVYIIKTKNDGR